LIISINIINFREERAKKYENTKAEQTNAINTKQLEDKKKAEEKKKEELIKNTKTTRLQFRFIDGTFVNQFESDQSLSDVKVFVTNKLKEMEKSTAFTMYSTFPKRDYCDSDMSLTLRQLNLTPSATIFVIPVRTASSAVQKKLSSFIPTTSSSSSTSGSTSIVTYATDLISFVLLPFTIIWGMISSLFFGTNSPSSNTRPSTSTSASQDRPVRRNNFDNNNKKKDDDSEATWNGNSTQQM
jgi:UBX domain-containing protein 1/4